MGQDIRFEIMPHLSHFLKYRFWNNAIKLLNHQLSLKSHNKHFNTLSMFYYEELCEKYKKKVGEESYFDNRIGNNLFYGLEEEFAIHSYTIPKSNLGLRKYSFLTYPMRVIYYAVGLYLLELSQEFIQSYYKKQKQIHSAYGGQLSFDASSRDLQLNYNSIWYRPHYISFRKRVRAEVADNVNDKVVIRIDVQNYFEEISISILLELLSESIKPSIQNKMGFDLISRQQIAVFFSFIANGKSGIPQTDNDVISSFIGHLYLIFSDLLLDQEIRKDTEAIKDHSIIRYMDDIYVSVTFRPEINPFDRDTCISTLAARISDILHQKLNLRLNTKTRLYWLCRESEINELLRNLKRTSPGYEIPDNEEKADPKSKVELIFKQLNKLKRRTLDPTFGARSELDDEILKGVYDKSVSQLLNSEENKLEIRKIFADFNFSLVMAQPKEILLILLIDSIAVENFVAFLLAKTTLTSHDSYLILSFLCQTEFSDKRLISLLRESEVMKRIIEVYQIRESGIRSSGYFNLKDQEILENIISANVIEQIRLRIECERRNEYSVSLNHLLNEIHAICAILDPRGGTGKSYGATEVENFLILRRIPHNTCSKIINLFDRRNKNPVSHPDPMSWSVGKEEYWEYHHHVGTCIQHLVET